MHPVQSGTQTQAQLLALLAGPRASHTEWGEGVWHEPIALRGTDSNVELLRGLNARGLLEETGPPSSLDSSGPCRQTAEGQHKLQEASRQWSFPRGRGDTNNVELPPCQLPEGNSCLCYETCP